MILQGQYSLVKLIKVLYSILLNTGLVKLIICTHIYQKGWGAVWLLSKVPSLCPNTVLHRSPFSSYWCYSPIAALQTSLLRKKDNEHVLWNAQKCLFPPVQGNILQLSAAAESSSAFPSEHWGLPFQRGHGSTSVPRQRFSIKFRDAVVAISVANRQVVWTILERYL